MDVLYASSHQRRSEVEFCCLFRQPADQHLIAVEVVASSQKLLIEVPLRVSQPVNGVLLLVSFVNHHVGSVSRGGRFFVPPDATQLPHRVEEVRAPLAVARGVIRSFCRIDGVFFLRLQAIVRHAFALELRVTSQR